MNLIKDKTFVLCLPGNSYSGDFMMSLIDLILYINSNGGTFKISQNYSSMVNFARCQCLGADVRMGKYQNPFGGIEYDYMLWIDSDIRFTTENFQKLVDMEKNIASGWYAQPGGSVSAGYYTPIVETMDNDYFKKNGRYQFLTSKDIEKYSSPFQVDYIGFGWVLIKRGIFEKLPYPWFAPKLIYINDDIRDMCSEDVAFCHDAKDSGFKIWVDPTCRVGHEKTLVI